MVNSVTIVGRLGQAPEVQTLDSGATVAKVSVATDENYKDRNGEWQKKTTWIPVVMWRNLAERAQAQLKTGTLVYVEGKYSTRKAERNGETRTYTEVVANKFYTLKDGRPREGTMPTEADAPAPYTPRTAQPTAASNMAGPQVQGGGQGAEEEDLPF